MWLLVRKTLGMGNKGQQQSQQNQDFGQDGTYQSQEQTQKRNGKQKVFSDDEGEYVDFEEIKS